MQPAKIAQHWYRSVSDIRRPWIWLVYLPLFGATWIGRNHPDAIDLIASGAGIVLFLAIYAYAARRTGRAAVGPAIAVLALALAMIPFGGNWTVLAVYACSMAAELRPAKQGVRLVGLFIAISMVAGAIQGFPWYLVIMTGVFEFMVVFGKMSGMALGEKHAALLQAQEEVRILAQSAERERIARDLHDLLGRTLTLIALKSDLAVRVSASDPTAAQEEMRAVAATAREGLAQVRAAVAGMTDAGLAREIDASRVALDAAGVACEVEGETLAVSSANGAVLAMALREAVTNVIRHARAEHCRIALARDGDAVTLAVSDDGHGGQFREGAGLRGMRARLAAAGGVLQIEAGSRGTLVAAAIPERAA